MYPMTLVQQTGIVTLGATGGGSDIKTLTVAKATAPFKNLSITVVPFEVSSYKVEILHGGEISETHTYPSGKTIAEMSYPDYVFPANTGTSQLPRFREKGVQPMGISIQVRITNNEAAVRSFEVTACFETYENAQFDLLASP